MSNVVIRVSVTRPTIRAVLVRPSIRVQTSLVVGSGGGELAVGTNGNDFNIDATDPAITYLHLPTASATKRGALSSADWSAFNAKASTGYVDAGDAATLVTANAYADAREVAANAYTDAAVAGLEQALTFTAPLSRVGNTISIPVATRSQNGYLSSDDFNQFMNTRNLFLTRIMH